MAYSEDTKGSLGSFLERAQSLGDRKVFGWKRDRSMSSYHGNALLRILKHDAKPTQEIEASRKGGCEPVFHSLTHSFISSFSI